MNLPAIVLEHLGANAGAAPTVETLRQRADHAVYRLRAGERSFIYKTFEPSQPALEIQIYALLQARGVPTLPVYASGDEFLLLEDLDASPTWRMAAEEDMRLPETGSAVASWYRRLHEAGRQVLRQPGDPPAFLRGWIDAFDAPALAAAGQKLGLDGVDAWQEAIRRLDEWKARYRGFPQTFNYSDFAAENLALTRAAPMRAIVIDYDCFATGSAFSDLRNVLSSLEGPARDAFQVAYGMAEVDALRAAEEPLDTVLATLEGIVVAARRERFPGWARPLVEAVQGGAFAYDIRRVGN